MSDKKPVILYTAAYDSVTAALTDRPGVRVIPEWFGGGTLQGADGCSQDREAHRGCHDR